MEYVFQVLRNLSASQFLASPSAQSAFIATVVTLSGVPSISIDLRSVSSPFVDTIASVYHANAKLALHSQARLKSPSYRTDILRKLIVDQSSTLVVYSAKCLTIALGTYNPQVAYDILSSRLIESVDSGNYVDNSSKFLNELNNKPFSHTGNFSIVLQQQADSRGVNSLIATTSIIGDLVVNATSLAVAIIHSPKPSLQPVNLPTPRPTRVPHTPSPTVPTLEVMELPNN